METPTPTSQARKVALITGCSSGIGMLSAIELARSGFHVVATMRDLGRSERLQTLLNDAGLAAHCELRQLDVTRFNELRGKVDEVIRDHGRLDVLVNNAGYPLAGFAEDISLDELRAQLDTNFFGHVEMTKAVLPQMRKQRSGHIIMISSIAGLSANPVLSSYAASKHALEGWSEALRMEMLPLGIKVVLIEPGAFATNIWEVNARMGAQAVQKSSVNKERSLRFAEVVKNIPKGDARRVAKLVRRVALTRHPRLRYLIGNDAVVRYWLRRMVPWRWYERAVIKLAKIG